MGLWFRMYSSAVNNAKVQALNPALFKAWVNILCVAKENDGVLPPDTEIAFLLRCSESQAKKWLSELVTKRLLDSEGETLKPHDWDQHQYISDGSQSRVNKYRERVRSAGRVVGGYTVHRSLLMERDEGACVYCRSKDRLCIDHVVPVALGGDDDPMNLAMACKICNSGKSGRTPEQAGMEIIHEPAQSLYPVNVSRLQKLSVTVTVTPSETEQRQSRAETDKNTSSSGDEDFSLAAPAPKKTATKKPREQDPPRFTEFWEMRWRDDNRKAAAKYFRKYLANSQEIISAVLRDRPRYNAKEIDFRPMMSTWLKEERWKDYASALTSSGASNQPHPKLVL